MRSILIMASAVALIAAGPSAYATTVTNVTTDTLVFSDGYEYLGTSVSHTSAPDTSGDYDPSPEDTPGSWYIGESDAYQCQVTDSTDGFDPGPLDENNYLRLRQTGDFNNYRVTLEGAQETPGDHIRFESAFYYHTDSTARTDLSLASFTAGGSLVNFIYAGSYDGVSGYIHHRNLNNGWGEDTGLTFELDKWNYVALDYVLGENTFSITINSDTATGLPTWYPDMTGVFVDAVRVSSAPDITIYHDMVPENWPSDRIPGDANEDGSVDVTDLGILATNYGASGTWGWGDGDFDGDTVVNVNDLGILATNYGIGTVSAVPEPSTLCLLIIGMLAFAWRRRK